MQIHPSFFVSNRCLEIKKSEVNAKLSIRNSTRFTSDYVFTYIKDVLNITQAKLAPDEMAADHTKDVTIKNLILAVSTDMMEGR